MSEPLELKKTLNLPKTDFPMKASLPLNEPKQLEAWQEADLYQKILQARAGKPLFVLHDGPPYPTGTIHLGTGLNKILKDLIVKTKSMAGYYAPVRSRVGLPRSSHRNAGRKRTWRQR